MLSPSHLPLYALLAGLGSVRAAIGPVTNLAITNADIAPDGFTRSAVLAGGTFPGALITGNKGDNFQINVQDELTDSTMLLSTSIHWHGIFQNGTNEMDGAAFVTQCPVTPGSSFNYNFTATDQAGTFWYHSHLGTQYCDGLRGPMVIYDPEDPYLDLYDVDDDTTVIVLSDWYHTVAPQAGNFPTTDSTLINGAGRYNGGPATPLSSIAVESGKRYRFRLINTSCNPNYIFSIDGHNLTIIEADGIETEPLVVDSIQIFAGQRYSFILEANQTVDNYWIRADPNLGTTGFDGGLNSAFLRYSGANATAEPTTNQTTSVIPMVEANLVPLVSPGAPGTAEVGGADVLLNLDIAFNAANLNFTINGNSFVPPTVPVLLQILSGAELATDLLPSGSMYVLPPNSVVELSMPAGAGGGSHPFHLHGHAFDVVRSAGQTAYNYANPPRRDVVSLGGSGDNVTIRWTTDNAGPWYLHCHIDWHLQLGLAIVFAEDPAGVAAHNVNTTAWNDLCPAYNALSTAELGGIVPS
ncbi:multicopper oxidase [Athelia psychrophila]|uniref:Multicopper oxidase n=1 Tax=Athelia psychrophila TaxID=1759441 RepID=A0A166KFW4_9AGAM|nr:multicopper oxidase [Fibularhizoctonia sp. CBS 109695]